MAFQKTLSIIKPDAVCRNLVGPICERFTAMDLWIVAARMQKLSLMQAKKLYAVHQGQAFLGDLLQLMTSGPLMLLILAGENAISRYRQLIGATDPKQALPGTLRADFATNIIENAVHGSDSPESAQYEMSLFFEEDYYFDLVAKYRHNSIKD